MAHLKIVHHTSKLMTKIPHRILINHQLIGLMNTPEINIQLLEGRYLITIQSVFPLFSASMAVGVSENVENVLAFSDREKWWDLLFVLDLALWIAQLFFTLPAPWNIVYKVFTNGYFALWLLYEWLIRKHYFKLSFHHSLIANPADSETIYNDAPHNH